MIFNHSHYEDCAINGLRIATTRPGHRTDRRPPTR